MEGSIEPSSQAPEKHQEGLLPFNHPCPLGTSSSSGSNGGSNSSPLVARLQKLLLRRMLIGLSDERFFLGVFHCIDKQSNIILQDAVEYRSTARKSSLSSPSPMDQRCLGLILIPSTCRTSCHVDCSIDEQLSPITSYMKAKLH